MVELLTYSLLAIAGVLVLSGAIWTVAAGFGAARALEALSDLRTRTTELEIAFQGFAEQYEISNTRSAAKIGKLRRKVERLEDGDDEDEESGTAREAPSLGVQPAPRIVSGSDVLRVAREKGLVR